MDKNNKRFKWLFLVAMLAIMVMTQFVMASARHAPPQTRRLLLTGSTALLMLPMGFFYGRNSGRKDQLGKIARFFLIAMVLGMFVAICIGGKPAMMMYGLGGGYLAGYFVGNHIRKRIAETHGDTIEADQVMNVARSEHLPAVERPSVAFVKSQDQPTRRVIWTLNTIEVVTFLAAVCLPFWLALADSFTGLSRALFVHPGDGTLYFITTDPIVISIPLVMIGIGVAAAINDLLLPIIAGPRKDVWLEFKRLRAVRKQTTASIKAAGNAVTCAIVLVLILAIPLFMDSYVKVTPDGIALNRFWGLGARFYAWTDIRSVDAHQELAVCRNCGKTHRRFYGKVVFTDGTEWKPDTSFGRREPEIEKAVRYIAARTGQ
jgi:hypothetical protein